LVLTIIAGPEAGRGGSSLNGLDFEVVARSRSSATIGEVAVRSRSSATIGLDAGGFLTLVLPLGFFAVNWAKPVMAKLSPNISVIAVFFIISTTIVTLVTSTLAGIIHFGEN
jgi:hypothetical protein